MRPENLNTPTCAAWLAGLWDGEGSVGVSLTNNNGRRIICPQIQINMTHEDTVQRVSDVIAATGYPVRPTVYQYKYQLANNYKPAYLFALSNTIWVQKIAKHLIPYAVTKLAHWELTYELCDLRIERQGLSKDGRALRRGGPPGWVKEYGDREIEIADLLREMNRRGVTVDAPTRAVIAKPN